MRVRRLAVATSAALIATTLAQTGPEAAQIPPCVKACDPPAIASVNCTNADQHCHCVRQTGILSNITACANRACEDPSADIYTFTTLFADVCSKFNISVPLLGPNGSIDGNVTVSNGSRPTGSSVPGVYTGGTGRWQADVGFALVVTGFGAALLSL